MLLISLSNFVLIRWIVCLLKKPLISKQRWKAVAKLFLFADTLISRKYKWTNLKNVSIAVNLIQVLQFIKLNYQNDNIIQTGRLFATTWSVLFLAIEYFVLFACLFA